MRKGELSFRRGVLVVLLLFLFGATLLLSVPEATDASPVIRMPDTSNDEVPQPTWREHQEYSWDLSSVKPLSDFQWQPREFEIKSGDLSWESRIPLDLVPFGTPHVPIIIDDNSDFETQSWPGEGTVEQPYIIAGLEINATTGESAINITNTDVHFFIKDCRLTSNSTNVIELRSVTHARITNNTILQGERGVAAFHSSDLTIYDNEF